MLKKKLYLNMWNEQTPKKEKEGTDKLEDSDIC